MPRLGITQARLATALGLSRTTVNKLVNHGLWPAGENRKDLKHRIAGYVESKGGRGRGLFAPLIPPPATPITDPASPPEEEAIMLLRKQSLTPEARRHFGLSRDPFSDPVTHDEIYMNHEIRYVRESLYQVARHGGFMAVIGESGSGKTTLREDLVSRIQREEESVIVIEPYVLAMEAQDRVGKTLRAHHIAEAIMAAVAPLAKSLQSPESRFRQTHHSLRDSARAGHAHVLLIEEAHCLPIPTLKHLKRFRELKDGLKPLLSIVLLGQPELELKLSEHNPELREVVQRIELVRLPALGRDLEAYLKHRFARCGIPLEQVLVNGAIEALATKLTPARASGTLLYPLAVHNVLARAMNDAAECGVAPIPADLIRGV